MKKNKFSSFIFTLSILIVALNCVSCGNNNLSNNSQNSASYFETEEKVSLDKSEYVMKEDSSVLLTAETVSGKNVVWESNNSFVASVDSGTVLAKAVGTATITARSGNAYAVCLISVVANDKTVCIFESDDYSLEVLGESVLVKFNAFDISEDGVKTEKSIDEISYTIGNDKIAEIRDGKLNGLHSGITTITAVCGELSSTAKIRVYNKFISNAEEWNAMLSKRQMGEMYMLDEDIDFTNKEYIGTYTGAPTNSTSVAFRATLNGNGHTVKNILLSSSANKYVSLFGSLYNAKIEDIVFENVRVTGVGAKAAGISSSIVGNSALIKDVSLSLIYENVASYGAALCNIYYGGTFEDVLVQVDTPTHNAKIDNVQIFNYGEATASNTYVLACGGITESANIFSYSSKMEMLWDIHQKMPFDVNVWNYGGPTDLPVLIKK